MKIAFFLDISRGLGGAGNLLLQQAVLMSEIHQVVVIIPTDEDGIINKEYAIRCERNGLSYRGIHYLTAYNFAMINFSTAIESAVEIEEFARKEKIEFFHSVQLNIAVEYVSRKLEIPHLMNIYQLKEEEFRIGTIDIYSHYHLCDSLLYSNRWKTQLGIESRCIRPVAPLDKIKTKGRYTGSKISILMLGDICYRKNQLTAIKAVEKASKCSKIRLELHIAGEATGKYADDCKKYVNEKSLKEAVFFYGFVSNVSELLEGCDCLLCSSVDESFPLSIVEALTYDLTLISTPVAGVPEIFMNKKNAFISKGYSEDALSESILECIEYYKNEKILQIHQEAKRTWIENFERKYVRKELDLYYGYIKKAGTNKNTKVYKMLEKDVKKTETTLSGIDVMGEDWIYKRGLYYLFVERALKEKKIYIWGAGKWGRLTVRILKQLCSEIEIIAFLDSSKKGTVDGVPIMKPNEIIFKKGYFYCISFAEGREDISLYLQSKGLNLYEDIWYLPI